MVARGAAIATLVHGNSHVTNLGCKLWGERAAGGGVWDYRSLVAQDILFRHDVDNKTEPRAAPMKSSLQVSIGGVEQSVLAPEVFDELPAKRTQVQ